MKAGEVTLGGLSTPPSRSVNDAGTRAFCPAPAGGPVVLGVVWGGCPTVVILVGDELDVDEVLVVVVVVVGAVVLVLVVELADTDVVGGATDGEELVPFDLLDPPQPASSSANSASRMGRRLTAPRIVLETSPSLIAGTRD
jgi:hypothetical protein